MPSTSNPIQRRRSRASRQARRAELKERSRSRRNRLNIIFGILAVLFVVAAGTSLWKWKSITKYYDSYQANNLVKKAEKSIAANNHETAEELLQEAFKRDRKSADIRRFIAYHYIDKNANKSIAFLEAMVQQDQSTTEDEVALLKLYMQMRNHRKAAQLCDRLNETFPDNPDVALIAAKLNTFQAEQDRSLSLVEKAIALDPKNAESRLLHATLKLESTIPETAEVAWQDILEIADNHKDETGLKALFLIKEYAHRFPTRESHYLEILRSHPIRLETSKADPDLEILEWALEINPLNAENLVQNAIDSWSASLDPKTLNAHLSWLNSRGYIEQVAAFFENSNYDDNPEFLAASVQSLILTGNDKQLAERLDESLLDEHEKVRVAFATALVTIDKKESPDDITEAFTYATELALKHGKLDIIHRAGYAALNANELPAAEVAFRALFDDVPDRARVGLLAIAEKRSDLPAVLEHLEALCSLDPGNHTLHQKTTYLQLLLKESLIDAPRNANRLLSHKPNDPKTQLVAAFAQYRHHRYSQALSLAKRVDPYDLSHGERAVLAVIHAAGGNAKQAKFLSQKVDPDLLLPPERDLFAVVAKAKS
ncbi:MAG: hypothetical protein AAF591_20220 [Verrucomicrobiota bacterium]